MPTEIIVPAHFLKKLKKLAKKYPSVLKEFEKLSLQLKNDQRPGDKIPGIGRDVYKMRLANRSAKRGKSGGFRVIYYIKLTNRVVLVTIYSKTGQTNISPEKIRRILEEVIPDNED
jgi:mRNA-degrading endonuclease RelE of RelBE toxin-antitoxin system